MTVTFVGTFSKRRNSTLRPSGGTSKTVLLKEGTSMMKPAFLLSSVSYNWNYCIWDDRYYYITDIVSESNTLFRVECELDVLATYKNYIGNYTTLISRAASDQDFDVIDSIYPAKSRPITKRTSVANPGLFTASMANGCYVLGTIGNHGNRIYVFNRSNFDLFCMRVFPILGGNTDLVDFISAELSQAVAGGLANILDNITFLKWIPISYSYISSMLTAVSTVYIGNWELTTPANELAGDQVVQVLGTIFSFAARDDAGARGRWLYSAPFANYSVYIPPFGLITLDPSYVVSSGREVYADIMANIMTGNLTLRLYYSLGYGGVKMAGVYNASIAADMKIGGVSYNMGGVVSGIGAALANYAENKYAGMIGAIASAADSAIPQTSQVGGGVSGPSPDLTQSWFAYASYYDPIDENQAELGRPLAEVVAINSLSGFVKCANAQISIPGHAEEMSEINGYLNSGFFYE